ncbi:MAG: hypothetical protein HY043_06660 [Verrucomicrobia bacterium]|nr:hypothetical protein [Verrucomicrobiota bacterium]
MIGDYDVLAKRLRFVPQFPLEPGGKYRVIFHPSQLPGTQGSMSDTITALFQAPARPPRAAAMVSHVYPSADLLPENLLKFYIHFSAPMSRGHIYEHIYLRNEAGKDIELPFLEIDEELWDPAMMRLTLFIDPGRIKRGVRPLEEIGPALEAGKRYTLAIDRAWRDATGSPLKEDFQKRFQVGSPDRDPPEPAQWKIHPPQAATRETLVITFPEPLDHALAQRVIQVAGPSGESIAGKVALEDEERQWTFTPTDPWQRGSHKLVVQTTLEDLAGNNIGKPFEVDLFEGVQRQPVHSTVKLPFEVP